MMCLLLYIRKNYYSVSSTFKSSLSSYDKLLKLLFNFFSTQINGFKKGNKIHVSMRTTVFISSRIKHLDRIQALKGVE
ncbi:hypothetical protein LPICM17_390027 [Lactococcus piscium]|nr:hypothetical protein LPICM17_390027 [Lactococcus piscium]